MADILGDVQDVLSEIVLQADPKLQNRVMMAIGDLLDEDDTVQVIIEPDSVATWLTEMFHTLKERLA